MFYLTGFHLTSAHANRLIKLTNSAPWPSKDKPLLDPQNIQKFPLNTAVLIKSPSEQDLQRISALTPAAIVDANALDDSIREFLKKMDNIKSKNKLGFLLTCPVIYACNIAQNITHTLQQFVALPAEQQESIHFALHESIVNGLIHGNLQLNSSMRQSARDFIEYARLLHDRLNDPSYAQKSISIIAIWNTKKLEIKIRDEGAGYGSAPATIKQSSTMQHKTGRGIRIIAGAADSCTIEDFGREITLSFLLQDHPIQRWTDGYKEDPASQSALTLSKDLSGSKVLVIEDNPSTQTVLGRLLNLINITDISFASDGVEGLKQALEIKPDLIILDITMPRMDGYEVIQHLKDNKETDSIPVLIQTASDNRETREKTFRAGATDFITKPINPLEFFSRVRVHLENRLLVRNLSNQLNQIETELHAARRMQIDMLPQEKVLNTIRQNYHLNIAHYFSPSSLLGGDFWQVIPVSTNKIAFYICDFSGHGVASALNTFRLHALVSQNNKRLSSPADFLTQLNHQMHLLLPRGQFATMFLGIYDKRQRTLTYAGAGAPNPILIHRKKQTLLGAEGMPLGILPKPVYHDNTLKLSNGDILLLYSDALTESMTAKGVRLGFPTFKRMAMKRILMPDPNEGLNSLLQDFFKVVPPPPPDDVTAVLLKWEK